MKKIFLISLFFVLMVSMFALTGCTKNDSNTDNNSLTEKNTSSEKNSTSGGFDLELDFKHMNKKAYNAHMVKNNDDKIDEYDEEEPNFVRYLNEKENYVLDLTLDSEAKDAYAGFQKSAEEDCDFYQETKFGMYEGYYADDNGDYFGYILLDDSDPTFNIFVNFVLYLDDEDNGDIKTIFNSSNIQEILNNIEFKVIE